LYEENSKRHEFVGVGLRYLCIKTCQSAKLGWLFWFIVGKGQVKEDGNYFT